MTEGAYIKQLTVMESVLRKGGKIAIEHFGSITDFKTKDDPAQVVTEIDIKSEKYILETLKAHFPDHSLIAEESGFQDRDSEYIWIVDPLDGTSNYAAGIGWFGVMVALLRNWEPVVSGIYLPISDELYTAVKGHGAFKNREKLIARHESSLKNCLVSYSTDQSNNMTTQTFITNLYKNLLANVRNLRSTNSAVDYVYAAEGKLGGLISHKNKLWDAAPIVLIAEEAGNKVSDIAGNVLHLSSAQENLQTNFTLVIARETLHQELMKLIASSHPDTLPIL